MLEAIHHDGTNIIRIRKLLSEYNSDNAAELFDEAKSIEALY